MEELKVHVMLWKFENNKNATETVKEISNVYDQGVITDCQVQNWFQSFVLAMLHWEMNTDQDTKKTTIKMV